MVAKIFIMNIDAHVFRVLCCQIIHDLMCRILYVIMNIEDVTIWIDT
jgi:hypothetical protein